MIHKGTKTLKTKRLLLRKFTLDDVQAVFYNWASDSEVSKYARQQAHISVEETRNQIADITASYAMDNNYYWGIVLVESDTLIGRINITNVDEVINSACVSFMVGQKWWGKGYTTEALSAVVEFFFEEVGMNRMEGRNDILNPSSQRVMMKCGFQYEGLLRQGGRNSFGLVDCEQYAIIAEDYNKIKL